MLFDNVLQQTKIRNLHQCVHVPLFLVLKQKSIVFIIIIIIIYFLFIVFNTFIVVFNSFSCFSHL